MAPATFGSQGLDRPHLFRVGALLTRFLSLRARILGPMLMHNYQWEEPAAPVTTTGQSPVDEARRVLLGGFQLEVTRQF
jgi:hypothetical protein